MASGFFASAARSLLRPTQQALLLQRRRAPMTPSQAVSLSTSTSAAFGRPLSPGGGRRGVNVIARRWMSDTGKAASESAAQAAKSEGESLPMYYLRASGRKVFELGSLRNQFYMLPKPRFLIQWLRPKSFDDFVAMISWLFMGNAFFMVVGTTTFLSVALVITNTLTETDFLARQFSNYMTKATGMAITFRSAIVPNWKERSIRFEGVKMTRDKTSMTPDELKGNSQFNLDIDVMEVKLSLARFFSGKGLLQDCHVTGMKGTIDYNELEWDGKPYPKRAPLWGDLDLEHAQFEDVHLTVMNPGLSYNVDVINMEMDRLRQQWMLYDMLNSRNATGSIDNALFSLHTRPSDNSNDAKKNLVRFKIVGMPFYHFKSNATGPMRVIKEGVVDLNFVFAFPKNDEAILVPEETATGQAPSPYAVATEVGQFIVNKMRYVLHTAAETAAARFPNVVTAPPHAPTEPPQDNVDVALQMRLRNMRATLPTQEGDWGYVETTMIRPMVAFINSHSSAISVDCKFSIDRSNFDGRFDIWSSGIVDAMAGGIYNKFLEQVQDEQIRTRRIKRVGLWSVQSITKSIVQFVDQLGSLRLMEGQTLLLF